MRTSGYSSFRPQFIPLRSKNTAVDYRLELIEGPALLKTQVPQWKNRNNSSFYKMSCPCQHLKWLEQNILQEKQWIEQLEGWSKLQRILLWRLHISHHHIRCKRKEWFRPGTVALREIHWYQKSTDLLIRRTPFQRDTYEIMWGIRNDLKNPGSSNKRFAGSSRRLIWLVCLKTPTCVLSMQDKLPSCQEMYS